MNNSQYSRFFVVRCITGIDGPSYDTWRRRTTVVSYDGPEVSYDGGVVRHLEVS